MLEVVVILATLMVMVTLVFVTPKQEETQTVGLSPTFLSLGRARGLFYEP